MFCIYNIINKGISISINRRDSYYSNHVLAFYQN